MKPYDPHACCPKCGHTRLTTRFYAAIGTLDVEHIRRSCDRCRYEFREAPLDTAEPVADNCDREQIERLNTAAHAGVTRFPVEDTLSYPPGPGGLNPRD